MVGVNNIQEKAEASPFEATPKLASTAMENDSTSKPTTSTDATDANRAELAVAPSGCATRGRSEDSALAAASLAAHLRGMNTEVLESLVRARESAAGIVRSFPAGDSRFTGGSDSESGEELEVEADGDVGDDDPCTGLFDDRMDANPTACLQRARDVSGLDLLGELRRHKVPFHGRIRAVNSIRASVSGGEAMADIVARVRNDVGDRNSRIWTDDSLLRPVIAGDMLLTALGDDESDSEAECDVAVAEAVHKVIN